MLCDPCSVDKGIPNYPVHSPTPTPRCRAFFFVEYKVKHDFILIGMIGVLVIILSSWVTLYFCGVESTDSTKENQPIIIVIKETVNVTQQSK